jgi:hypothetical protein
VSDEPREVDRLIQGYLDDALTDDEARRLHELLKASPDRLDDFIRAVDLHGSLASMRTEFLKSAAPAEDRAKRTRRATRRLPQTPSSGSWVWGLSAAGILFAAALLFGVFRKRLLRSRAGAASRSFGHGGGARTGTAACAEESRRAQARLREIEENLAAPQLPSPTPKPEVAAAAASGLRPAEGREGGSSANSRNPSGRSRRPGRSWRRFPSLRRK